MSIIIENEKKSEILSFISDYYKDAYGSRPRGYNYHLWSLSELEAELDRLEEVITANMAQEEIWERASVRAFNELILKTISLGAGNRKTALRWLFDGSGVEEQVGYQDYEHFIYQQGMLSTKEGDAVVKELVQIYKN